MPFSSWVEVDLDILDANLDALKKTIGPDREILLVVKADAYGHGAVEVARAAAARGVKQFGVATLHEGMQLRGAGLVEDVWVLSPLLESEIPQALAHRPRAHAAVARLRARAVGRGAQARAAVPRARRGRHRHGPHRRRRDRGRRLSRRGRRAAGRAGRLGVHALPRCRRRGCDLHAGSRSRASRRCSPRSRCAVSRRPWSTPRTRPGRCGCPRGSWASCGPGSRPTASFRPTAIDPGLTPAMSFHSRLVQVRRVRAGRPVSYGRTFTTPRDSVIGVVPVGYGHGYSWLCSNRGAMLVAGQRVPIVGRVTMDLTMLDLTELAERTGRMPEPGDSVILFGRQNGAAAAGRGSSLAGARRCPTRSCARSASASRGSTCGAGGHGGS